MRFKVYYISPDGSKQCKIVSVRVPKGQETSAKHIAFNVFHSMGYAYQRVDDIKEVK